MSFLQIHTVNGKKIYPYPVFTSKEKKDDSIIGFLYGQEIRLSEENHLIRIYLRIDNVFFYVLVIMLSV